jgi:hypothetical protein
MKLCTAVIAAALLLAADAPARADEDCDTVVKALEDVPRSPIPASDGDRIQ